MTIIKKIGTTVMDVAAKIPLRNKSKGAKSVSPQVLRKVAGNQPKGRAPNNVKNSNQKPTSKSKERFTPSNSVSFERLFKNAAVTDSKYVRDVTVTTLKRFPKNSGIVGYKSETLTVDEKGPPRKYRHYVISRDNNPVVSKSKAVKISCQCSRFLYNYEYALWKRGAADINFSNGDPASTTNPANIPSACLTGDTLIDTDRGLIRIDQMKKGDWVWTTEGFSKVTDAWFNGVKPTFKITLQEGSVLKATADHLVRVMNETGYHWKRVDNLEDGDFLLKNNGFRDVISDESKVTKPTAIKSIKPIGNKKVYDISVKNEQFYANGILVHNCKHVLSVLYSILKAERG